MLKSWAPASARCLQKNTILDINCSVWCLKLQVEGRALTGTFCSQTRNWNQTDITIYLEEMIQLRMKIMIMMTVMVLLLLLLLMITYLSTMFFFWRILYTSADVWGPWSFWPFSISASSTAIAYSTHTHTYTRKNA